MKKLRQNTQWKPAVIAVVVLLILTSAGYYFWQKSGELGKESTSQPVVQKEPSDKKLPKMANLPDQPVKSEKAIPEPSYPHDATLLEKAREALAGGIGPEAAIAMAESLPDHPEKEDAVFLLAEYAAESGLPEAALIVAQYYDPSNEAPSGSIRKNPLMAYDWYIQARDGGQEKAGKLLERLRGWAEAQAETGSKDALELLDIWE